jgi:hypothetical protein
MVNIQNKKWSPFSVIMGMLIFILLLIILIPNYQNIDIAEIYLLIFSVYLIIRGIFHFKTGIWEMVFGSILLVAVLIWGLINKSLIISFETIFFFITSLLFIIGGILMYSGYMPRKWLKTYK